MPISKIKGSAINDGAITLAKTDNLFENTAFTGDDGIVVPKGTTAERPVSPTVGEVRFNTTLDQLEQYTNDSGWQGISPPPVVASVDVNSIDSTAGTQTIVITGSNFDITAVGALVDANGTTKTATTSTRNSSTQITIVYSGGDVIGADVPEPLDVKVTNGSGLAATLEDVIGVDDNPVWTTASGSLGTVIEDEAISTITLQATDPETGGSITYTVTSGSLPTGLSLNSSTGAITGTPNVNDTYNASGVTHNFSVTATGADSETTVRAFSILRKWYDGSTSALAASSASAIKTLTSTTTDGQYWIEIDGTARQIYCDMNNDGGGWMFAGRMNGNTSFWQYSSSYWTNTSVNNATSSPSSSEDIKTYAWFAAMTQMRYSMGSISNSYVDTHSSFTQSDGTGLNGVFSVSEDYRTNNAEAARNTNQTRTTWINLFNGAGIGTYGNGSGISWDNCNYRGVNIATNTNKIQQRYGISINNESECTSSDYFMGIGFGGSDHLGNVSSATKENYTGSSYRSQYPVSWLYVK